MFAAQDIKCCWSQKNTNLTKTSCSPMHNNAEFYHRFCACSDPALCVLYNCNFEDLWQRCPLWKMYKVFRLLFQSSLSRKSKRFCGTKVTEGLVIGFSLESSVTDLSLGSYYYFCYHYYCYYYHYYCHLDYHCHFCC